MYSVERIEVVPITSITINPKNVRKHSEAQIEQIAQSMDRFGVLTPIIVDEHGMLWAGEGRYLAMQKRGVENIPVIRISHLTEAQKKAFLIADNKLALNSSWDALGLDEMMRELNTEFSFSDLGFSDSDMARLEQEIAKIRLEGIDEPAETTDTVTVPEHERSTPSEIVTFSTTLTTAQHQTLMSAIALGRQSGFETTGRILEDMASVYLAGKISGGENAASA